ncbi:MAG: hypothetical protein CL908_23730 [Deltaproteobacteria bacterium]|nr:hypothetical protein [Deltaproteobacteria bacterium]
MTRGGAGAGRERDDWRRVGMTILHWNRALLAALACCALACAMTASSSPGQSARDDVPEEYAELTNPFEEIPSGRIRYWERQYKAQCARCHGIDGRGGGKYAAEQWVPPRNFTDSAFMATRSDGQLFYQIRSGGGERSGMPAYGPGSDISWSEEKIWKMVLFLRRFAAAPGQDE